MEFTKVDFEKKNGIGFITLNNQEARNAIVEGLHVEVEACLDECDADEEVRAIVLRGSGPFFSVGGNIRDMKKMYDAGKFDYAMVKKWAPIITKFRTIRKPIIASAHGAAAGAGASLVLACDYKIVTEDTKFTYAFANLGLIPDLGGVYTLVKTVGPSKATELMMTAKQFSGKEACDWGLVNESVPADKLEEATMKIANQFANGPTKAYGAIKTLVNRISYNGLDLYLDNEFEYQDMLGQTEDHKEGVLAFLEKRKPTFKGK